MRIVNGAMSSSENSTALVEKCDDVMTVLRCLLQESRAADVESLVAQILSRNSELEKRLAAMLARGKKREGVSAAQLLLELEGLAQSVESPTDSADARPDANDRLRELSEIDREQPGEPRTQAPKQPPTRQPAPAHLPRVENLIVVPASERACPRCGEARTCIGHDLTEVIELVPAKVIVRQDKREKLACGRCEGQIVRAPVGDKVVPSGKLGLSLVSHLLVGKYGDGLPLHRQRQMFARLGVTLPVSTLADQIRWSTDLLRPVSRAALAEVIDAAVMHLDGTGLAVLDSAAPGGKRYGSLWGYVGGECAAYVFASTGKKIGQKPGELGPADVLARRTGYTVADASNLFDSSFRRPELIECGCNMHARRYFTGALDAGDKRAALPLAAYKRLYEIEAEIRDRNPDERLSARQSRSLPVWTELVSWAKVHKPHEPPASPLGEAIRYLLNHQVALGRFLEAAIVPIDNGAVERLHVRTALTRKNYLFAGSDAAGERAAIAYTILACCRLAEVNPLEYLADVLPRLARRVRLCDLAALLPHHWKAARQSAVESIVP